MPTLKLKAPLGKTQVITSGSAAIVAAARGALSAAWANGTDLAPFNNVVLTCAFGTAPIAGRRVQVYAIPQLDSNYMDGSDTVTPSSNLLIGWAFVRNTTGTQRLEMRRGPGDPPVQYGPHNYKFVVENLTDQTMSAAHTLDIIPHQLESV